MQNDSKKKIAHDLSILKNHWKQFEKTTDTENLGLFLDQKYKLPQVLAPFLSQMGIHKETFDMFLNSKIKDFLPDPFFFKDMKKTVCRLAEGIEKKTPIGIFGDYDVDGATSAAMLRIFFSYFDIQTFIHIPDRFLEGYGPNEGALEDLISKGSNLIITVDCGISSFKPLSAIQNKDIDVIILDHHTPDKSLPPAYAIINPKRKDNEKGFEYLCAAGVTFIMLVGLNRELRKRGYYKQRVNEPNLMNFLDLVALGTVCDVVPLVSLNRVFVQQGIILMKYRKNIGIKSLSDISNLGDSPDVQSLSFGLGPRINAGGRIGSSKLGVNLLIEDNEDKAIEIALKLDQLNKKRKIITSEIESEAIGMVEKEISKNNGTIPNFIIASNDQWHEGVIGIIAGKLKDKYNRPACVITFKGKLGKGSARSIKGLSMGDLFVSAMKKNILLKGGGHDMAAGLTIEKEKLSSFKNFISNELKNSSLQYKPKEIFATNVISVSNCNYELAQWIEKLGPWGEGAPEPNLIIKNSTIKNVNRFGANKEHISFTIKDPSGYINCKKFNIINNPLNIVFKDYLNKVFDFVGVLKINKWNNKNEIEFHLVDIITK